MATKPTPLKIVGGIIKALFYTLIAAMAALLIWRVYFSTNVPKSIDRVIVTDALAEAYAEQGENLEIFTQSQASITRAEENYGYFSVVDFIIIPEAKETTKNEARGFFFPREAIFPIIFIGLAVICQGMLRDGVSNWMPSLLSETFNMGNSASILCTVSLSAFSMVAFILAGAFYKKFFKIE